jgi:hypothetical protein
MKHVCGREREGEREREREMQQHGKLYIMRSFKIYTVNLTLLE